ncbi:FcoT family thioesterase [Allokutzneria albata]|uniref:(2E)-enoyl-[ACP] glycyltransferase n=1 Tax=Allokutzneria albata TaxID=211114 RepID=A0A1G9VAV9_ALLAB|nr:FcoT family thioesterase [Allokutzneria albata]SDM69223.1 FcoT-like thioesterase domain-containing protein [Allokutzneria albata]
MGDLVLERVLRPYKVDCRYLVSADLDGDAGARGDFVIPESCYIDDTGHFNSVEFNICYNQLVYYLMARAVRDGTMPDFAMWTLEDYWRKQLPDILIASFESRFKRPINARRFSGEVVIGDVRYRAATRPMLLAPTEVRFWDDDGGAAQGKVLLAIMEPPRA